MSFISDLREVPKPTFTYFVVPMISCAIAASVALLFENSSFSFLKERSNGIFKLATALTELQFFLFILAISSFLVSMN